MGMVPVPVCMGIDLRRGMGLRDSGISLVISP